jgi:hypothetical protein
MITIKEWKWEKVKAKERKEATLDCPYCATRVRAESDTRIFDTDSGSIKYHIHKCPECFMPIIIGLDGNIIPQSQVLPFEDVRYLPVRIEKLYNECRKSYGNECFHATIMVARSLLMHVAVDKGATSNLKFIQYIDYLETEGYISKHNRNWVDKIRITGNQYIHELDEATSEEANIVMIFIKQLLGNVYEMPELAR